MKSQLYISCKVLAIGVLIAGALTGIQAVEQPMHPGPVGVCSIASTASIPLLTLPWITPVDVDRRKDKERLVEIAPSSSSPEG